MLMRDALAAHPDVDGVFCTNDDIAMGALPWCRERQLAVPEQILPPVSTVWRWAGNIRASPA